MKSWRWMVLGLVVLGVGVTLRARADDTPEKQATPAPGDHDGWMRLKLVSSEQIFKGLVPFVLAGFFMLVLLSLVPQIALFLPESMK